MDDQPTVDLYRIAEQLSLREEQVASVATLLEDGNTVPFITRYRKEQTGNLDEQQIRDIEVQVGSLSQLAERAGTILRLIDAQGKLTDDLKSKIMEADSLKRLEDLYLPYRPKRKSRALLAKQKGLEPLADRIWNADASLSDLTAAATEFVDAENELPSAVEVLKGAADIIAERISDSADVRQRSRQVAWQTGNLRVVATKAGLESGHEYRDYFDYNEPVKRIPPHRILALNRGDKAGALRIKLECDNDKALRAISKLFDFQQHRFHDWLLECANDALCRLIQPSLEREIRREITERAESHAVSVFARNLKNLLLQPPIQGERILAVDPGFRTGCKVAVLDEHGTCVATDLFYVTGSAEKRKVAVEKVTGIAKAHNCSLVAIGNGTACRETEELIAEVIASHLESLRFVIVNEAGASVYSTSTVAREEFPNEDATVRGTISIGRRLQDPLSELVKIEPQHIGVGMYQHDVNAKQLKESLDQVIESCVNYVGVDLNTASSSLLRHVSGLNQLIARRIVEWRDENGPFESRRQMLDVPGIGEATFTQAAGFLKITTGSEPLDATWIHPESYPVAQRLLSTLSIEPSELMSGASPSDSVRDQLAELDRQKLVDELEVGRPTLDDIIDALMRPGRDPRTDIQGPVFKQGVLSLDDLSEGMELTGTVLNVVDFGAFVDIGLKDSGLVHLSKMSTKFTRSPHDVVSVGDVVTVWVLNVDLERRRVSLTMIRPGSEPEKQERPQQPKEKRAEQPKRKQSRPKRPRAQQDKQQREHRKEPRKPKKPKRPVELTDGMVDGREPMKGFDQLQELWRKRDDE